MSVVTLFGCSIIAQAEVPAPSPDWLTKNIRVLTMFDYQDPASSTQNPDNAFARLYRYSGEVDLRPDLIVDTPIVGWSFKPRVTYFYRWWEDGVTKGERDDEARFFVNEWMIQPKPTDNLFLSFGKEKLLWGNSFLVSPSNILFRDTEKVNPKAEVEGKYLAQVTWLPSSSVTVNLIGRTQKEENALGESAQPVRSVKVDVVGGSYLVSLINYFQQHERFRLGSYGQWTASDAVVLYYDGIVSKGTDVLYPVVDPGLQLSGEFQRTNAGSGRLYPAVTAGGSYTFLSGETLSLEFLYNGAGYNDDEADAYYQLRQNAALHFLDSSPIGALSQKTLVQSLFTGSDLLRRYYLMAQLQSREIKNVLNIIVRYTHGLEEHAGQTSSIIEWKMTDRLEFFNINTVAVSRGRDTEFNALLDKSFLAGVEAHF
ncbi:MAG TPA: hypothetical protein VFK23_03610 [Nitrospirota bacterium]|nr:hypothetical protein [Nitrospirota bacterium]